MLTSGYFRVAEKTQTRCFKFFVCGLVEKGGKWLT